MTQTVLLGDIVDVIDSLHQTPIYSQTGYPMVRVTDIKPGYLDTSSCLLVSAKVYDQFSKKHKPRKGDIIFSRVGTEGIPAYVNKNEDFCLGQNTVFLVPKINQLFLYYWLISPEGKRQIAYKTTGSTQKTISLKSIKELQVLLPEPEAQNRIADILGTIDEKIELNCKMNETLEQIGQALFRYYFIDNPEAKKWEEKSLDDIADFLNGLAMQKYPMIVGQSILPVIKIREMSSGVTANTDLASAHIPEQYIVHNGDLLFSWSGTLLVKFWSEGDGALNQHLFKVTSKEYPEWLYYYWTKHHLNDFIQTAKSKATTMGHIQRGHLKAARVFVPDEVMMHKIGDEIQPLIDEFKVNSEQIQTLTILRDTLLPRLISGKVKA